MQRLIERVQELRRVTGGSTNCGWMVDPVCILLYGLVKFYKPDLVIQTGHLFGKSALVCLEAMTDGVVLDPQRQNSDVKFEEFVDLHTPTVKTPEFDSIDPHPESVPQWQAGIDLLSEWYLPAFTFFKMTSAEYFHNYTARGHRVMTIIDGDHSPEGCRKDLVGSANIGAKLIFLDDIDWIPHIGICGMAFSNLCGYTYTPFHIYNGVAILSK